MSCVDIDELDAAERELRENLPLMTMGGVPTQRGVHPDRPPSTHGADPKRCPHLTVDVWLDLTSNRYFCKGCGMRHGKHESEWIVEKEMIRQAFMETQLS